MKSLILFTQKFLKKDHPKISLNYLTESYYKTAGLLLYFSLDFKNYFFLRRQTGLFALLFLFLLMVVHLPSLKPWLKLQKSIVVYLR
jgi:hypothetical protein